MHALAIAFAIGLALAFALALKLSKALTKQLALSEIPTKGLTQGEPDNNQLQATRCDHLTVSVPLSQDFRVDIVGIPRPDVDF